MKDINEISTSNFNNKSNLTNEKKNWVSPEINHWDPAKLENVTGVGGDGAAKSYVS